MKTRTNDSGNGIGETQVIVPGVTTTVVTGPGQALALERRDAVFEKLRYAWLRRSRLLRFGAWGLVLSMLVAFMMPNRYKVTTRLMPPEQSNSAGMAMMAMLSGKTGGGGGAGAGAGSLAADLLGMKSAGGLFVGVLHSATVADRLIDQFDLRKVYGTKYDEDTRRALAAHTDVNEDKRSGIISIEVTDRDPNRAAGLAAAYVDQLDRLVAQLNTGAAHRERVFLEDRLQHVNADLEKDEKEFGDFASKNSALDVREEGKAILNAGAELEGELIAAQSELEGLRQIYADSNVRVRSVQARITELQRRIGDLNAGQKDANANSAEAGDANRSNIFPSIRKLPLIGVTWADLYRQAKVQETVFEVLTQQYELAKVQEAKETPSVKVLDAAKVPDHKSFPPRLIIMILGSFCSVLIGLLWTRSRENWEALDEGDTRKLFAREVWQDMQLDWQHVRQRNSGNGSSAIVEEDRNGSAWPKRNGDGSENGHND